MNKYRKIMITLILSIVSLLVVTTGVFAWLIATKDIDFVNINHGSMSSVSLIKHKEETIETEISIDDLAFIDFNNDVIENKYQMLNRMAASLYIKITAGANSIPLRNKISLDIQNSLSEADGLFYLVIIEGVNVETITSNYHNFIGKLKTEDDSLLEDNLTYTDTDSYNARKSLFRNTIDAYNEKALEEITDTVINANDYIAVQIVFWGDFETLPADDKIKLIGDERDKNIRIHFDVLLSIETVQEKGREALT